MPPLTVNRFSRWLAIAGGLLLLWTIVLEIRESGWSLTLLGFRLSSRDPFRSLITGAVLGSVGLSGLRFKSPPAPWFTASAALLAMLALLMGLTYGTFVIGGADTYGYVSQADLWLHRSLITPTQLASEARWRDGEWAMTPLGYRPALHPGFMVPTYPIGLPVTMAALKGVAGDIGAFLVSPLLGALAVWLTFLLGRALHSAEAGLLAAIALVASPIFLFYLMVAMSDVPVTAWWLGAVVVALKPERSSRLALSGAATAMAIMTRPNLVALTLPIMALIGRGAGTRREQLLRWVWWGFPASLGVLAVAVANTALYGSPFQSGYGAPAALFSPRYTWTNLVQFFSWMIQTQTPFVVLGVAAASWHARWCLTFAAFVLASYLWYLPFDDWTYLRFLLPALPMLLVTSAIVVVSLVHRYDLPNGVVPATALLLLCAGFWQGRSAFGLADSEARYRAASVDVAGVAPPDAVILSNVHSGSVRYYGRRITLRYEWLAPDQYNEALRMLRAHGHAVFALLDEHEIAIFRQRYAGVADLSWLDRLPLDVINDRVYLYAVQ